MKFHKTLVVGITESLLDSIYWDKIKALTGELKFIAAEDPQLISELADTDALLVYFNKANKEMIDAAPKLKYIGALATGIGKIDTEFAASKGIIVTNIPGYSTESVAEFVFAILLEQLREIGRAKKESGEGNRSELGFSGMEIKGKHFGVLGLGRIGARVAELAGAFGAQVSYWSRNRKQQAETANIKFAELDQVLAESDILSLHFSLNKDTEKIINQARVNLIRKGALVINTAPLELFDLDALLARVKAGEITFIFDHTDPGDISVELLAQFQKCKNCITYPAMGYVSQEARKAKQEIFLNNIKSFLEGNPVNNNT